MVTFPSTIVILFFHDNVVFLDQWSAAHHVESWSTSSGAILRNRVRADCWSGGRGGGEGGGSGRNTRTGTRASRF